MAMSTGSGGGLSSEINVTPMIDVLLVLLVIFLVVIALGRTAVAIQIPPVETATRSTAPSDQIVLELRDDGNYYLNGTVVANNGLAARIREVFDPRPVKLLFIKPGPNRRYGDVIDAVDIALGAGVQIVGFTPIETNGT